MTYKAAMLLRRLENAAMAVVDAQDAGGLRVMLCSDPMNIDAVRNAVGLVGGWFRDPGQTQWLLEGGERAAARNLKLLAALLEAHLAASE